MPIKIIRQDRCEIMGEGIVLLTSRPTSHPGFDTNENNIVEECALLSKSYALITMEGSSRHTGPEITNSELDTSIREFLNEYRIKCVIQIGSREEPGIAIYGTGGDATTAEALELVRARLALDFAVNVEKREIGAPEKSPSAFQVILVEIGPDERGFRRDAIVAGIADAVGLINGKLGRLERD